MVLINHEMFLQIFFSSFFGWFLSSFFGLVIILVLKETVSVFSSDIHVKIAMSDLKWYPCNLNRIKKCWRYRRFFFTRKKFLSLIFSISKKCANPFCRETTNKNNLLQKQNHWYIVRQLSSLNGVTLEITHIVPLMQLKY